MSPDRARHEVESLQTHVALVLDLVPKVYFYDPTRYIFAIEDLSDHEVWRGALNKSEVHDGVAAEVGLHINLCPARPDGSCQWNDLHHIGSAA